MRDSGQRPAADAALGVRAGGTGRSAPGWCGCQRLRSPRSRGSSSSGTQRWPLGRPRGSQGLDAVGVAGPPGAKLASGSRRCAGRVGRSTRELSLPSRAFATVLLCVSQIFEQFVKTRVKEEYKEKRSKLLLAKEEFRKLLEESKVSPRYGEGRARRGPRPGPLAGGAPRSAPRPVTRRPGTAQLCSRRPPPEGGPSLPCPRQVTPPPAPAQVLLTTTRTGAPCSAPGLHAPAARAVA